MNMYPERINDEPALSGVVDLLQSGRDVVVQFSRPGYTETCLEHLNRLCITYGSRIQVRFYGHYSEPFDCSWVLRLPHVVNLAVDCLPRANAVEHLRELANLEMLHIGVYEGVPSNILDSSNFFKLKQLTLSESKGRKIDLSPLQNFKQLQRLFVAGQTKGIEAIGSMKSLHYLGLSMIGKNTGLSFASELSKLQHLNLILGGRENIDEVFSASIEKLEVCRVQGLTSVALQNFPNIVTFDIADQSRLENLVLSGLDKLTSFRLANCPLIADLPGFAGLPSITKAHLYKTALDFDALFDQGLPISLESFALYSMSAKQDRAIHEKLALLGLFNKGD